MGISNPGISSGVVSFDTATNATVALTANTAASILAANADRKYVSIVNPSTSDVTLCLAAPAGTALGAGIILKGGGGSFEITSQALYTGEISGISAGVASLGVVEGE